MRQLIDLGLYSHVRQLEFSEHVDFSDAIKILLIGPGEIKIPSNGWGAVETIIAETKTLYEKNGYEVTILNSNYFLDWVIAGKNYDVIINHNDRKTSKIKKRWKPIPLITYSHYGYGEFEEMWSNDYHRIVKSLNKSDFVICLNQRIRNVYSKYIEDSKLLVSPNGSSFNSVKVTKKNNRFVCVGKIETRKRQFETWMESEVAKEGIEFIGPIVDLRVVNLLAQVDCPQNVFIGPRSRDELSEILEGYSALILPSLGEADALVLYEAQLAGLPIFVTLRGVGAQDLSLEWINVIPLSFKFEDLVMKLASIKSTQKQIQNFARLNYSWDVRHQPVLELLRKVTHERN